MTFECESKHFVRLGSEFLRPGCISFLFYCSQSSFRSLNICWVFFFLISLHRTLFFQALLNVYFVDFFLIQIREEWKVHSSFSTCCGAAVFSHLPLRFFRIEREIWNMEIELMVILETFHFISFKFVHHKKTLSIKLLMHFRWEKLVINSHSALFFP